MSGHIFQVVYMSKFIKSIAYGANKLGSIYGTKGWSGPYSRIKFKKVRIDGNSSWLLLDGSFGDESGLFGLPKHAPSIFCFETNELFNF